MLAARCSLVVQQGCWYVVRGVRGGMGPSNTTDPATPPPAACNGHTRGGNPKRGCLLSSHIERLGNPGSTNPCCNLSTSAHVSVAPAISVQKPLPRNPPGGARVKLAIDVPPVLLGIYWPEPCSWMAMLAWPRFALWHVLAHP